MGIPAVAIVGRPNVGKSSLLNMLARMHVSIVDPRPGVTRDRVAVVIEHEDRYFEAVDTGGIGIVDRDHLEKHVEEQIHFALHAAAVVVFVVDTRDGITPLDATIADTLRRLDKPLLLVANKADTDGVAAGAAEFSQLGLGEPLVVSAKHYRGRTELLDRVAALLPASSDAAPAEPVMKLAIIGKRNAGKSTLVNALAGESRVIVSEIPGTTRDAVDVRFEKDGKVFIAIDTAGVRKKGKMVDVDYYSYTRATRSIRRADVVMLLIDATVPISDVDQKLARYVADNHKPVILTVNKWDLAVGQAETSAYDDYLTKILPEVDFAPIVFTTARDGRNVDAAVDAALMLFRQANTRVGTGQLNAALESVLALRGPSPKRGTKAVKIYYATQVGVAPPTIVFFCNDAALVGEDYRRFMENRLREMLPYEEVPIRMLFRTRGAAAEGEKRPVAPRRKSAGSGRTELKARGAVRAGSSSRSGATRRKAVAKPRQSARRKR